MRPPFSFGYHEVAKEVIMRPVECTCSCHPVLTRPKVYRDRRCEECWADSGMSWGEFLSALDAGAKVCV